MATLLGGNNSSLKFINIIALFVKEMLSNEIQNKNDFLLTLKSEKEREREI